MKNKVYDRLKWVSLVLLPALGTLYFAVGQIWHFPAVEQVVGTITAVDTFLGLLVTKSASNYQPPKVVGDLIVTQEADGTVNGMRLEATEDPLVLPDTEKVVFEVKRRQQEL